MAASWLGEAWEGHDGCIESRERRARKLLSSIPGRASYSSQFTAAQLPGAVVCLSRLELYLGCLIAGEAHVAGVQSRPAVMSWVGRISIESSGLIVRDLTIHVEPSWRSGTGIATAVPSCPGVQVPGGNQACPWPGSQPWVVWCRCSAVRAVDCGGAKVSR